MLIGTCRLELIIPESRSLKNKRQVLKSLKDRIRNKFNVSVAEIDHQDLWQRSTIGIAMVANEYSFIDRALSQILNHIHSEPRINVIDYGIERH